MRRQSTINCWSYIVRFHVILGVVIVFVDDWFSNPRIILVDQVQRIQAGQQAFVATLYRLDGITFQSVSHCLFVHNGRGYTREYKQQMHENHKNENMKVIGTYLSSNYPS